MKAIPSLKPALFVVSLLIGQRGHCAEVALNFDTLPSSQGWTYFTLGQPAEETAVFTVANGSLLQNTVGIGGGLPGTSVYRLLDSVNSSQPFTLTMRARVLNDEDFTGQQDRPFGFSVAVFTGVEEFGFGLSKQSLQTVDGIFGGSPPIPFDATAFHDYRIEAQPGVRYDLFVDSVLFTSGSPYPLQFPSSISLGDGTGAANATAEITRLEFSQLSQVPEPSTFTLALAGAVALFGWQWKRALGTAF